MFSACAQFWSLPLGRSTGLSQLLQALGWRRPSVSPGAACPETEALGDWQNQGAFPVQLTKQPGPAEDEAREVRPAFPRCGGGGGPTPVCRVPASVSLATSLASRASSSCSCLLPWGCSWHPMGLMPQPATLRAVLHHAFFTVTHTLSHP